MTIPAVVHKDTGKSLEEIKHEEYIENFFDRYKNYKKDLVEYRKKTLDEYPIESLFDEEEEKELVA